MAIRIINYGKFNKADCETCGCKFVFDTDDKNDDGTVNCPQCDQQLTYSDSDNKWVKPVVVS